MAPQIKTLRDLENVAPMFGESAQQWVALKIAEAPGGLDEEVLADDTQLMFLLLSLKERDEAIQGKPI